MQKSVNRHIGSNPEMDDVDHALGRPRNPLGETYRNHYCAPGESGVAKRMSESYWWHAARTINGGKDIIFVVTKAGRQALADFLVATKA